MRNLKKLMALVLTVVMVFALASVASAVGYADITDKADITNKDAVALLVDLGVINGIKQADGTIAYKPNDIVDRATMAKLISYVKIGNVDASVFAGTATDLTDIGGTWAEGYIKYCYANGIISGDGAGHFFPTTSVNVVAAAKMLLVALGYNPEIQGYVGTNWAVNIMKDATTAGLLDGISANATTGLTRDNAARMIYNALDAKEAYYTNFTGNTVQFKNNTLGLATYGAQEIKGIVTGYTDDTTDIKVGTDTYTLDIPGDPSLIGRKVSAYAKVKTTQTTANFVTSTTAVLSGTAYTINDTISSACVLRDKVLATSVNGTSYTKLTSKTDSKYIGYAADTTVAYYYNGVLMTAGAADGGAIDKEGDMQARIGNRGVEVQFVDTDADSKYDAVYATEYGISYVKSTTAAKTGVEAKVTLNGVTVRSESAVVKSNVIGDFDDLAKNDVVMYAVMGTTYAKVFVYEPTTFEGKLTSFSSDGKTLKIDGTSYTTTKGTANNAGSKIDNLAENVSANGTAKYFVDKNGYIVAMGDVDEEVNYCVIDSAAWVAGTGAEPEGYAQAKLVFADGTTKTVTVSEIDDVDVTFNATPAYDGIGGATAEALSTTAATNDALFKGVAFTYVIDSDGEYELTTAYGSAKGSYGVAITAGTSAIATGAAGNNTTIYVIKTKSGSSAKFTVYTGYKNVPKVTGCNFINIAKEASSDTYAALVYVDAYNAGTVGATSSDYAYILDTAYTTEGTGSDTYYVFDALVEGETASSSVKTKSTTYRDALAAAEGLYEVSYDANGYVNAGPTHIIATNGSYDQYSDLLTGTRDYFQGVASAAASGGVFRVKNAGDSTVTYFTYDGTEKVYIIDDGALSTLDSVTDIEAGWTVYVKVVDTTDSTDKFAIDTIFAVKDTGLPAAPTALALAAGSTNPATVTAGNLVAGTGAVTAWTDGTGDTIKITATAASGTTVTLTLNGAPYTSGADYDLGADAAAAYTLTVVATVTETATGNVTTYSYTLAIPAEA